MQTDRKRIFALVNNVSATVYDIISEKTNFDTAIIALVTAYIKPVSVIFNRHKLISCNQEHNQSIDSYLQDLECISKTCGFEAVRAEENKNQYARDTFINGQTSSNIRQHCLKATLSP